MELQDYQKQFISFLVNEKILLLGDFLTKSGRRSPYFINMGLCASGYRMEFLSRIFAQHIHAHVKEDINVIFGPAYKGIVLSACVSQSLYQQYKRNLDFFYNRKEAKDHGEGGVIVGGRALSSEDRVLLIDDVITAGTSLRESQKILSQEGNPKLVAMSICVDRMEHVQDGKTAVEAVREQGISVYPIVNIVEVITWLSANGGIDAEQKKRIDEYWKQYGVKG